MYMTNSKRERESLPPDIAAILITKLPPGKHTPTISFLSRMTHIPKPTLYHVFAKDNHLGLSKFKRVAEMLQWSLKDFSKECLTKTQLELRTMITAQLGRLGISAHHFHKTTGGVHYYRNKNTFRTLRTYSTIAFYLGITLDDLANILLTKKSVDNRCNVDNMVA